MTDLNAVMKKIGGGRARKAKGLPKRTGNPTRKERRRRSVARLPEKKLRHVLRRNGAKAAVQYMEGQGIPVSVYRRVCVEQHRQAEA